MLLQTSKYLFFFFASAPFFFFFFSKLRLEAFGSGAFYLSSGAGEDDVDFLFGFCAVVVNRPNSDGSSPLTNWPPGCLIQNICFFISHVDDTPPSGGETLARHRRFVHYKVALLIETAASSSELVLVVSQAAASGSQTNHED